MIASGNFEYGTFRLRSRIEFLKYLIDMLDWRFYSGLIVVIMRLMRGIVE